MDCTIAPQRAFAAHTDSMPEPLHVRVGLNAGAPHAFDAIPEFGRQTAAIMALFLDRHVVRPREVSIAAVAAARA